MNPVLKLQPRSNSTIPFQIQEKTIAEASIISLLVKTYFPPKPITQQHGQKDSSQYTYIAEQSLDTGQHGLPDHLPIQFLYRNILHLVDGPCQQSDILPLKNPQPAVQDGRSQGSSDARTDKAQYTQSLKEMLERNTFRHINCQ